MSLLKLAPSIEWFQNLSPSEDFSNEPCSFATIINNPTKSTLTDTTFENLVLMKANGNVASD